MKSVIRIGSKGKSRLSGQERALRQDGIARVALIQAKIIPEGFLSAPPGQRGSAQDDLGESSATCISRETNFNLLSGSPTCLHGENEEE